MNNNEINRLAIAQLNYIAGDIEYNSKKIIKTINDAKKQHLGLIIFQQNSVLGVSINNILSRFPFLIQENKKWLNQIAKLSTNISAVVGFTNYINSTTQNSLAIINNGEIVKILSLNNTIETVTINNLNYGFFDNISIISDEAKISDKTDILVFCKPTISTPSRMNEVNNTLTNLSLTINKPIIFINNVGATDNISYCGESSIFYNGKISGRAKSFEEDLLVYDIENNNATINNSSFTQDKQTNFSLNYEYDMERTYKTIVQGIRDYFNKNNIKRACIGLSGGLDSTVSAVLLVDAIGVENVIGVSMPSVITSSESKNDAKILAHNLGIGFIEAPIKNVVSTTQNEFEKMFDNAEKFWEFRYKKSFTNDNIQARARATYLWGLSNEFEKCIPIATSDKSEAYMGYATINGDMSGGFAPIADVTKTKLFALAKWLNKNRVVKNVIPESVIHKRPGAELAIDEKTGKPLKAEDALMPYEFLDEIIWRIENKNESYKSMMNDTFLYEQSHFVSDNQKKEWLDKFFKRMQLATYKWTIMPPSVVLDDNTINKSLFNYPISSNINFKQLSEEKIYKELTILTNS